MDKGSKRPRPRFLEDVRNTNTVVLVQPRLGLWQQERKQRALGNC